MGRGFIFRIEGTNESRTILCKEVDRSAIELWRRHCSQLARSEANPSITIYNYADLSTL